MAEREGFEPSVQGFNPVQRLSKPPLSATQPPLPIGDMSIGGGGGIRTPGPLRVNGFQDRRIRPLCHPSALHVVQVGRSFFPLETAVAITASSTAIGAFGATASAIASEGRQSIRTVSPPWSSTRLAKNVFSRRA